MKRKGFDLVNDNGYIQITLEPKSYPKDSMYGKDKWLVEDKRPESRSIFYITSLRDLPNKLIDFIPADITSYVRR